MRLPPGRLIRSRVLSDPRTVFADALDRELTGYATLESQDTLLLDGDGNGVVTFEDGVPVVVYHTGADRGGPRALADLAANGPYRLELFATEPANLAAVHDCEAWQVPPGMPAERLAGDQDLAERTRAAAPDGRTSDTDEDDEASGDRSSDRVGAVEAFLEDEAKVEAIREQAREDARRRADEWGFDVD